MSTQETQAKRTVENIEALITEETERRLKIMGEPGYPFPPQAGRADAAAITAAVAVSILLIALCVTGVIV